MVGVLIVTDARFHREGLAEALSRSAVVRVVGTAADFDGLRPLLTEPAAEVMLLDADLPNAIAVTRHIVREAAHLRVVALGLRETAHDVIEWAEAGLAGFVSRDQSIGDLVAAITSVARGELVCPPRIASALMSRVSTLGYARRERAEVPVTPLTYREQEIALLVEQGLSNKEIAYRLGIQLATIKTHVHHILEKLRVRRRIQIAALARKM
jgi:DNA-binding NarL/FixJ family response regulator